MNAQVEARKESIEKTLGKLEWLLSRSEQANRRYSRAQMEAFSILRDSFKARLEDEVSSDTCMDMRTERCLA